MKELLISTSYFPSLTYCKKLLESDTIKIDTGEHFIKQSHRNRTVILGANGRLNLIVPIAKWKNNSAVKDIRIAYFDNWQKLHWKSLESAYRSSPYFEYYEDKLRDIVLNGNEKFLVDLNDKCLEFVKGILEIESNIIVSKNYIQVESGAVDIRNMNFLEEGDKDSFKSYTQVFSSRFEFQSNLSCVDLICNEGPNSIHLLD